MARKDTQDSFCGHTFFLGIYPQKLAPYLRLNSCKYTPRDASGRKVEWLKNQQIQGFANFCQWIKMRIIAFVMSRFIIFLIAQNTKMKIWFIIIVYSSREQCKLLKLYCRKEVQRCSFYRMYLLLAKKKS